MLITVLLGAATIAAFTFAVRRRRQGLLLVGVALAVLTGLSVDGLTTGGARSQWTTRQVRDACESAVMREATSDRLGSNSFEPTWYPASNVWQWELVAETRGSDRWVETIWMCEVEEETGAVYLTVKP